MANIQLSQQDIDYISRVVATEVPARIARTNPAEYTRMVGAVVDTITNRMASGQYPDTVSDVVNQRSQFTKINGPLRENPYGSVENTPVAPDMVQAAVENHIANRVKGVEAEIGDSMNYANPNVSDRSNIVGWIKPMIDAGALKLGLGKQVHYHGTIPGTEGAPAYSLSAEGMPEGNIPAPFANPRSGLLGMIGDVQDPGIQHVNAALETGTLQAPTYSTFQDMALAGPVQTSNDPVAYAMNPANVPSPTLNSLTAPSILSGFQNMAAANPIAAPMDVTASGYLGTTPGQDASLSAFMNAPFGIVDRAPLSDPTIDASAVGELGLTPGFDASTSAVMGAAIGAVDRAALQSPTYDVTATGILGRTTGLAAETAPSFTGIYSPEMQAMRENVKQQLKDMAAERAAAISQPSVAAVGDISATPGFEAAAIANPTQTVSLPSVTATGDLGLTPGLGADATVNAPTGLLSSVNQPSVVNPGLSTSGWESMANAGILSMPSAIAPTVTPNVNQATINAYKQAADSVLAGGVMGLDGMAQTNLNGDLASITPAQTYVAPALDTVQVAAQPTVAEIGDVANVDGPASTEITPAKQTTAVTPALTQTVKTAVKQATTPVSNLPSIGKTGQSTGILGNLFSQNSILGGLTAGPLGILGSLLSKTDGLNGSPMNVNNIGSGLQNVASVYGGAPVGTQATTSNNGYVTSLPGNRTAYTNAFGVTTITDPNGAQSSWFGSPIPSGNHGDNRPGTGGGGSSAASK